MTEFEDEAIVLSAKLHGESGAILHVLTENHGVYAAHVAGGASRRMKAALQPGASVLFRFRARHSEQLGTASVEASGSGPDVLDDSVALLGLQCACLMTRQVLPERERHPGAYYALSALLGAFVAPDIWPAIYVRYEAGLLEELGYGLDLSACAVTGSRDDLVYVSPKSARAVSRGAGEAYRDKLLVLPQFLLSSQGGLIAGDVGRGLALTGFFLERHVFHPHNKPLPDVRLRLAEALADSTKPN
ncbi:DNA repair protein RecO [Asticcacaulis biprosthecium C19]|uniref:DNA repair protein RecO n=1 Tax=Asticcacaulis biprosthecium C19 TaxID=715226 RepID=F4QQZ3_9CAUL|nr:DNA repair protein RecO [Asticcacaulis biprosthecium]EGF90630.1 DNA repair protein RecO [Asticcacaulis biprosthecium C19]